MTTSARGLSFERMMRSMMSATCVVARTVIVLAVLFGMITGATGICGTRMIGRHRLRQLLRVGVRDVEDAHDHVVVLLPLVGPVVDHDDRLRVDHLVEQLVGRHDLLQRLFDRDVFELDAVGLVLVRLVVGDADPGAAADDAEDVADARVVEVEVAQALAQAEQRRRPLPRLFAQRIDARLWTRRLDPLANAAFQLAQRGRPRAGWWSPSRSPCDTRAARRRADPSPRADARALMCFCAEVCMARCRAILYSGLSGFAWTAS